MYDEEAQPGRYEEVSTTYDEGASTSRAGPSAGPRAYRTRSNSPDYDDAFCDGPLSVVDQVLKEAEKYPECREMIGARMLIAPPKYVRPCKVCCKVTNDDGSWSTNPNNYSQEDIADMIDFCAYHTMNYSVYKRALARMALEKEKAEKAEAEKIKRMKKAKAEFYKKKMKEGSKPGCSTKKTDDDEINVDIEPELFASEDEIDEYLYGDSEPEKKKPTRWLCPVCDKSSQYGSVGCKSCGEWYHFKCAGYKKIKDVPTSWYCDECKT